MSRPVVHAINRYNKQEYKKTLL